MRTELVLMALCAGLLAGCATAPRVAQIEHGTPVAFVVVMSPPEGKSAVHNIAVTDDAGTGAMTGATAGALSGLLCGPAFIFCSPLGALIGAGAGGVAGAAAGAAESLPKDKAAQLDDRLRRLQQSIDPLLELRTDVLDQAGKHWELTDDTSGKVVILEVQNLFLTAEHNKNIKLVMQVLVSHRTGEAKSTTKPGTAKRFSVITQGSSLSAWLDERSELPEAQLRSACQQMATQVVSELAFN